MKLVDEETRAIVRNARLDALEADNYGTEDPEAVDDADRAYVDEEAQGAGPKDKKKARTGLKRSQPTAAVKSTRWKVKSLAQLLFEEVLLSAGQLSLGVSADASLRSTELLGPRAIRLTISQQQQVGPPSPRGASAASAAVWLRTHVPAVALASAASGAATNTRRAGASSSDSTK